MSAEASTARLLLVDDHLLFRHGLALILRGEPDLEVVGVVGTARDACELAAHTSFDVALVDVLLPKVSGATLCRELYKLQPSCKVLIVSAVDDPSLIAALLRGHSGGFVLKSQSPSEVIAAIHEVRSGSRYLPPSMTQAIIDAEGTAGTKSTLESLTKREREIFELIIHGGSTDEIASQLCISRRTVETHRQRVMNKLSVHSLLQMQRVATRLGGWGEEPGSRLA